jgi:hypothetical protein
MEMSTPVAVALLGAAVTVVGYFVTNALERRRALRLRELGFRLDRYKEFLLAFSELHVNPTPETQLRFVNSVNVILLIGSAGLLSSMEALVNNYNDEAGTAEKQQDILRSLLFRMRGDLDAPDSDKLAEFQFPLIVPDLIALPEEKRRRQTRPPSGPDGG